MECSSQQRCFTQDRMAQMCDKVKNDYGGKLKRVGRHPKLCQPTGGASQEVAACVLSRKIHRLCGRC